ncbi:MAG: C25 family cysteine peptidase, partial [Chloroflexi bacterium]|nr:C25 family cysteine peptidase [Chloroflexota bacterium]
MPPLPEGDYDLQAVATDTGGRVDPTPTPIAVTYTDVTAPADPSNLAAGVQGGEVTLTWSASGDPDLAGYLVYRAAGSGEETLITSSSIPETTYLDTGLADDLYAYRVTAIDLDGNESAGDLVEALVYTPQVHQPLTPRRDLLVDLMGSGEPEATVAGELINAAGTAALPPASTDGEGAFRFEDLLLALGENTIHLRIRDAAGNLSKDALVPLAVGGPPTSPTGLAASVDAYDVHLTWNPNPEPEVIGYRPFRDAEALLAARFIAPLSATASDVPASAGDAVDGDPDTAWWPDVSLGGQWIEVGWSDLRIVDLVELDWWTDGAFGYWAEDFDLEVWSGAVWVPLFELRGNATAGNALALTQPYRTDRLRLVVHSGIFDSPGLAELRVRERPVVALTAHDDQASDGIYAYQLTALNAYGFESELSEVVEVSVGDLEAPAPVVLSGMALGFDVHLTWTPSASPDVVRYDLYRDGAKIAEHADLGQLLYIDRALPSATYVYLARAVDAVGNESPDSNLVPVTISAPPGFPLTVATVPEGQALDLAWEPALEPPAASFRLWRSAAAGGPYAELVETTASVHRDAPLLDGTPYFYVVVALDAAGDALAHSNEASGVPQDSVPPSVPDLHHPVSPGVALAVRDGSITLAATAEPEALVEFLRDEVPIGVAPAAAVAIEVTGVRPEGGALRLSPDGETVWGLTFDESGGESWLLHHVADGHDEIVLEHADRARWTADSRRLVFATDGGAIRAYDVARRTVEDLAAATQVDLVAPSPALDRLAVVGERDGSNALWIVDLAAGTWVPVTTFPGSVADLEWSPTGTHFVYRASVYYLVDAATAVRTQLPASGGSGAPAWSPDGQAVLYPAPVGGGLYQVRRYRLDLGLAEQVTFDPSGARFPQWSPDGRRFAFWSGAERVLFQEWATGATETLYESPASCSSCSLQWVSGGPLWIDLPGVEWRRWSPPGLASLPHAALAPGLNSLTALARDAAGNASPPSPAISVDWASAGAADLAIAAADLTVLPGAPEPGGPVTAAVTVHNSGATASSPSELLAYVQGPAGFLVTLFAAAPLPALPPGGAITLSGQVILGPTPGAYELVATADPFDRVAEADETNNIAALAFPVVPPGGLHLSAATDQPVYERNEAVAVTVEIAYGGDTLAGRLGIRIEDVAGIPVDLLLDEEITLLYGDLRRWEVTWDTATSFAGAYRAAAELLDEHGSPVSQATAGFTIAESFELAAVVTTDRSVYSEGEAVQVSGEVHYLDGNTLLLDLEGRLELIDPAGESIGSWTAPIGALLPGSEATLPFDWSSTGHEPGAYRALWSVLRDGLPQATADTGFELEAPPGRFSGSLALDSDEPPFGVPVVASFEVTNDSIEPAPGVAVRVRLIDPADGVPLEEREWLVDLVPGATHAGETSFDTEPLEATEYLVALAVEPPVAEGEAPGEETLAVESFVPVDRTAPLVALVQPLDGGFLGLGDPAAVAQAVDERSGIARAEARLDEGPWVTMAPADPSVGTYRLDLSQLVEGAHRLELRATDGAGNTTTTVPADFVADWTPPAIDVTGVEEGGEYEEAVTPLIAIVESYPALEETQLDGEPFVSGTPVEEPGNHLLEILVEDAAGNRSELAVGFTLIPPGQSRDLVVNTVNDVDDGNCDVAHCSLREAILAANHHPSFDTIRFAIPGLGVERIVSPHSPLPTIDQPVWVDGESQPGSTCVGEEPRPAVVLDGSHAGTADGLTLATWGATVRGLTVRRFGRHGLRLIGGGNHSIACMRLGDDGSSDSLAGNGGDGIRLENGTAGNALGAGAEAGTCEAPCNVIGFNGGSGIALAPSAGTGNAIRRNRIHRNEGLGIDLAADGLTTNDPNDADAGPNERQNFPNVAAVRPAASSEVDMVFHGAPGVTVAIDLFRVAVGNAGRDGLPGAPPFGEGDALLDSSVLTTDPAGRGTLTLLVPEDLSTTAVTATATHFDTGSTSEFSPVFAAHFTHALVDSFRAEVDGSGAGVVTWTTVSEAGTLGFDLYRETSGGRDPDWQRVNERLVVALFETPAGASYRVGVDALQLGTIERFVLVEVESGGARRLLGPYVITVERRSGPGADLPAGRALRQPPYAVPVRWPRQVGDAVDEDAPSSSRLKVGVRETTGYRLTAAAIAAPLGTDEATARLRIRSGEVQLTSRGETVPWFGADDGSWLVFYGAAPADPYSPESIYWLELETGAMMAAWDGGAPPPLPGGNFTARRAFEENLFAATVVALDPDEDFWFWRGLSAGDPVHGSALFVVDLPGFDSAGSGASLAVSLYGASALGIEGEHVVEVRLAGVSLGTTSWSGIGWHEAAFEVPRGLLAQQDNQLELVALPTPGVPYSFAYVNRFEVSYPRHFEAEGSRLLLASDGQVVTVDGFTDPDLVVLEVTDPGQPRGVTNLAVDEGVTYRASFVPDGGEREYWTGSAAGISAPAWIAPDVPSDLHSTEHAVDLLVISTPELLAALAPLIEHRRSQGWRVLEVDLEDVYDEFNDGFASPHALRALLRHAAGEWTVPPRWVLLAGAGTYDYRDHLQLGGNFVPPLLTRTANGLFSADGLYADLLGEDGIPDVAIGRIPAKSAAEAAVYAAKVVAYETQAEVSWLASTLLVADDRDGAADFGADTLVLAEALPPGSAPTALLLDQLPVSELRSALFQGIEGGAGLLHYLGHGGVGQLAAEPILSGTDVPALANGPRLPVVFAPTCVAARHEIPSFRSLAEQLVVHEAGGAVAVVSSSGLSQHGAAAQLSRALIEETWTRFGAESLGEALLAAYESHLAAGGSIESLRTLTLLGDPSLRP